MEEVNNSPCPDRGVGIQFCPGPLLPTPPWFSPLELGRSGLPMRGPGSGQAGRRENRQGGLQFGLRSWIRSGESNSHTEGLRTTCQQVTGVRRMGLQ